MIISGSNIGMESVRKYSSLRMDAYGVSARLKPSDTDFKDSMENIRKRFETSGTSRILPNHFEESAMDRIRTECINFLIRLLFGIEVDDDVKTNKNGMDLSISSVTSGQAPSYEAHYFRESEELSYKTAGKVITADGREIDFGLSFSMSRSFEQYYEQVRPSGIGNLFDPLVINLDTDVAGVSDQKFLFDIDTDGIKDNISLLNKGSGFLALDKNDDGIINDGSELFGASSGDGFKDLSAYDLDGNGWIDEADDIWDKLIIYSPNADGSSSLYGLSEKGVGAIYLGNISTDYSLNSTADNSVNGIIRKTGVFLYENGNAGTIQHMDLAG
ncbi:MAG: hypothetical protein K6F34_09195 [Lachnospiraceae bacterium]|nr:hypothetical protein [Lachnospiraceae bacterium]